jgi:hypothetical protein
VPQEILDFFRSTIRADLRRAFLSGLGVGILIGWLTTMIGMAIGWAIWQWWMT